MLSPLTPASSIRNLALAREEMPPPTRYTFDNSVFLVLEGFNKTRTPTVLVVSDYGVAMLFVNESEPR